MKYKTLQYAKTLYEMTKDKNSEELQGVVLVFANFLRKENITHLASKIISDFSDLYNKKQGIIDVEIISKDEVKEKDKVLNFIKKEFVKTESDKIKVKYKKDKSIKGGIIIKTKNYIIDGSIKAKIINLKKQLS